VQFWNALVRKNKVEGASEEDMEAVIAIHNNMNENTWSQVSPMPSHDLGEILF
jgi:cytochrome c heme-lyase